MKLTPTALDGLAHYATQSEFELAVLARPAQRVVEAITLQELVRLARIGLQVEGAPIGIVEGMLATGEALYVSTVIRPVDSGCVGKRVALVVLEDSN